MPTLVFLRGLNTWGDDDIHVGPLRYGPMHAQLEIAFRERGVDFIPLTGIGAGSPEILAERSAKLLEPILAADPSRKIHLLGHSTGGLVGRALATLPAFEDRVRSIITIGTPHRGAFVATLGVDFDKRSPWLYRLFTAVGYDTRKKVEVLRHLTPDYVEDFNRRFPSRSDRREISLLCDVPRTEISPFYKCVYGRLHPMSGTTRPASDGFIWCESQKWGEVVGPFALDHFAQLGCYPLANRSNQKRLSNEFHRMVDAVVQLISQ